jgi:hypothetical protein
VGDGDAQPLARQLVRRAAGEEAVGDDVVRRRRVLLQDAESAMVVGDHQPRGRDEAARAAAADLDGGVQEPGPLTAPQLLRRDLQTELPEPLGIVLEDLLRRPLSFHGKGLPGGKGTEQSENGTDGLHGAHSVDEPPVSGEGES